MDNMASHPLDNLARYASIISTFDQENCLIYSKINDDTGSGYRYLPVKNKMR